jgi:long-chain acyl-CoA synthetase
MTNIASLSERSIERFGDVGSVYVPLSGPDIPYGSADLHGTSVRLASALRRLGVDPGDRVVVMIPNAPEIFALYAGIARAGAVILPILFLLADAEIGHILRDAEPAVVITSGDLLERVRSVAADIPSVRHVITIDPPAAEGALDLAELVSGEDDAFPIVTRDPDDLALLIYTGGTTGRPKGVMLTHGNLAHAGRSAAEVASKENDLGPDDVSCSALPLAHSYGVLVWLVGSLIGGRSVLMRWFDPATWFRCVEEYRCTTSPMVPTMLTYLLNHPGGDARDLSSLRFVNSGAAALPTDVARSFEDRSGCVVLEGWGLTESVGVGTMSRLQRRRSGSVGLPAPDVDIAIRDPDTDAELAAGELGEICMRGPHVMKGYWRLPDDTADALRGGWLRTGDIGSVDEDGYLFIVDRTKDLIIRGGFNVYPRDVEEVLHAHPAVLEAAVVGVPDPTMGEEIKGFVVVKPGEAVTEEELLEHSRAHLAKYKTPRTIGFLDSLPKSGVGKVLRRQLRDQTTGAERQPRGTDPSTG